MTEIGKIFQLLPSRFRSGKITKTIVYHFTIDDEDWTVTLRPDRCEVTEGKREGDADCFLKTSSEILFSAYRGQYIPSMTDFVTGKIKTNRPDLLWVFRDVFGES